MDQPSRDLSYDTFKARRGRWMAWGIAVLQGAVLIGIGVTVQSGGSVSFDAFDRFGMFFLAVLIGAVIVRIGSVRATPSLSGLSVRNVLFTRNLEWAQIVNVRFGGGDPWVTLDLSDGASLAVMGIQRADGQFGTDEARRLATLVALHTQTSTND